VNGECTSFNRHTFYRLSSNHCSFVCKCGDVQLDPQCRSFLLPPPFWAMCNYNCIQQLRVYRRIKSARPVILHNLQRESHKHYCPPNSVIWQQVLCKQTNTRTSVVPNAEKQIYVHDFTWFWHEPRFTNITCSYS